MSLSLSKIAPTIAILTAAALNVGCKESVAPPEIGTAPSSSLRMISTIDVFAPGNGGGAIVTNRGNNSLGGRCWYGSFQSEELTAVHTPSGRTILSCHFSGLTPVSSATIVKGFGCSLSHAGETFYSTETIFVQTPGGQGQMTCRFPA